MHKPDAVIAGHICLDITPKFPEVVGSSTAAGSSAAAGSSTAAGRKPAEMNDQHPASVLIPGTLVTVDGVDIHPGGVVANTGLAMQFFGNDVSLMGKIGTDVFGTMLLDLLNQWGTGNGMVVSQNANTSYSIVLALPGQDRIFLHDPGANHTFTGDDVDYDLIGTSRLFHFGYPPQMRRMYERDGEELVCMFKKIDELGVLTSLDLAAVDDRSPAAAADWELILSRVLPHVDFFLPSYEELAWMLDLGTLERLRSASAAGDPLEALSLERDVRPLADKALSLGAKVVVIKCGAKGLFGKTMSGTDFDRLCGKAAAKEIDGFESWREAEQVQPAISPRVIRSATGAGDTCIAAFLTAMLRGYKFSRSLTIAAAAGASCLESWDALGGLKSFEELTGQECTTQFRPASFA